MKPHRKNPTIANVFSQMGIVEELGSGTRKMFKYTPLYANGMEPIIEEQDVYRIEIPYIPTLQGSNAESTQKTTQKTTQKVVGLMRSNPMISIEELAEICGITRDGINYHIKNLKKKGIVKRIGGDKGGHWEVIEE